MNLFQHTIPEPVKELLRNPDFVLWCYAPTEESEEQWSNWIEQHPEKTTDLAEAKAILQSARFNAITLSGEDSKNLYDRIEADIDSRKKNRRTRMIWYRVTAACAILALAVSSWLYIQTTNKTDLYTVNLFAPVDSTQTEVELELTSRQKVMVNNKATIELNNTGTVHIDKKEIAEVIASSIGDSVKEEKPEPVAETKMNVLKVPRGRHSSVVLADGTKVWVNSGTVLHFPNVFEKNNRTIYASGEIYLEVAKDPSRPFYVKTSKMDVRVLGTHFNVTAYEDETNSAVVLVEGGVEITTPKGLKQKIQPNERLVLKGNQMEVSNVNVYDYTSWKDGVFLFNNQRLTYVTQRLSRYYRMEFVCDPEVEYYTCSGKLVLFDDLNKVLHTLEKSLPISCEINGNTINLSTNTKKRMPMK